MPQISRFYSLIRVLTAPIVTQATCNLAVFMQLGCFCLQYEILNKLCMRNNGIYVLLWLVLRLLP